MIRAPRYPSTGDTIHADHLAIIYPAGRTFSIFHSDDIEMNGLVSVDRNGLLFYDNDREVFLHRPVFADLLSSSLTPLQVGVINEFKHVRTWADFRRFLLKLDKTLILDQFRQYLLPENPNHSLFVERAKSFCAREGMRMTDEELSGPDALRRLSMTIGGLESLHDGFFLSSVPDIMLDEPDPSLRQTHRRRRAERWLNVAGREDAMPADMKKALGELEEKQGREAAVARIVESYMATVDKWEGSPIKKTSDGGFCSRADIEDYLTSSATVYCPSPLGWTPRLRFAFYCPESFKSEPLEVQVEVMAALERKISEDAATEIKLIYIPEMNCLVLESVGGGGGGPEIACTFENGQQAEMEIINLDTKHIVGLSMAVESAKESIGPEQMQLQIENARLTVREMQNEESLQSTRERGADEIWAEMGQSQEFDEVKTPEQ